MYTLSLSLSIYYVPDIVLGTGYTDETKESLPSCSLCSNGEIYFQKKLDKTLYNIMSSSVKSCERQIRLGNCER